MVEYLEEEAAIVGPGGVIVPRVSSRSAGASRNGILNLHKGLRVSNMVYGKRKRTKWKKMSGKHFFMNGMGKGVR
jgi:hypothetical protein